MKEVKLPYGVEASEIIKIAHAGDFEEFMAALSTMKVQRYIPSAQAWDNYAGNVIEECLHCVAKRSKYAPQEKLESLKELGFSCPFNGRCERLMD